MTTRLLVVNDDITGMEVDAIVNADISSRQGVLVLTAPLPSVRFETG
ncbi:MAG: hypothetical protein ISR91_01255 [Candidatus Delongbacteria bacterium]|nr:hypothetical protein [Candidatus Delongbacteria bacterium]